MEENLYTPDCIRTFTGKYVNIFEPKPEMFNIIDIAHGLAHIPRFGGHTSIFYSVARHCINCTIFSDGSKQDKYDLLMHDCTEAYLLDIPSPIKKRLEGYKEIEENLMSVLSDIFKFNYPLNDHVKELDKRALEWEWQNVFLDMGVPNKGFDTDKRNFIQIYNRLKPKDAPIVY